MRRDLFVDRMHQAAKEPRINGVRYGVYFGELGSLLIGMWQDLDTKDQGSAEFVVIAAPDDDGASLDYNSTRTRAVAADFRDGELYYNLRLDEGFLGRTGMQGIVLAPHSEPGVNSGPPPIVNEQPLQPILTPAVR